MEDKEDGEVSDANSECDIINVYQPCTRPERPNSTMYRNINAAVSSDDDSDSSDLEFAPLLKKKRIHNNQSRMDVDRNGTAAAIVLPSTGARKKNNIWANVIQEESLTEEISGVGLKRRNRERDVESYDYTNALTVHNLPSPEPDLQEVKIFDFTDALNVHIQPSLEQEEISSEESEDKESFEDIQQRMNRKRRIHERLGKALERGRDIKPDKNARNLIRINTFKMSDIEVGALMAEALYEPKAELIVRIVETLGQELTMKIYNKTRDVEEEGGMMILNGGRRRTSGGVFLQLLKNFEGVEKNHLTQIFIEDTIQWRKRKRVNRRRHNSKPQAPEKTEEVGGLQQKGLFGDAGSKCPGSTPITTPQGSDEENDKQASPLPLKEACEKAAFQLTHRNDIVELQPSADHMDVF